MTPTRRSAGAAAQRAGSSFEGDLLRATIPGAPQGFPRPRFCRATGVVFDDSTYSKWKAGTFLILRGATTTRAYAGLVAVAACFVLPRPQRRPEAVNAADWSAGTRLLTSAGNDVDGYVKALLDVLQPTKAQRVVGTVGVIEDDRLVCFTTGSKWYAARGETACTEVVVSSLTPERCAEIGRRVVAGDVVGAMS